MTLYYYHRTWSRNRYRLRTGYHHCARCYWACLHYVYRTSVTVMPVCLVVYHYHRAVIMMTVVARVSANC